MKEEFIYYTLQGDYTLESLKTNGYYFSTIENNYRLIDLVKHHFNSKGIVYYFKIRKSCSENMPTSGRGNHLIKLNGETLSKNRIEFSANKFSKAMMMCDALCRDSNEPTKNRQSIEILIPILKESFGVDFDFFKNFGNEESDIYVGLTDIINNEDVQEIIENYRH